MKYGGLRRHKDSSVGKTSSCVEVGVCVEVVPDEDLFVQNDGMFMSCSFFKIAGIM